MIHPYETVDGQRQKTSWRKVLVDLAQGELVPGYALGQLPGYEPEYELKQCDGFQLSNSGPTMHLVVVASRLAAEVDHAACDACWLADAVQFHMKSAEAIQSGEQPGEEFRRFAWLMGMTADYAAGLRSAVLI